MAFSKVVLVSAVTLGLASVVGAADCEYINDFTTRTITGASANEAWQTVPYPIGTCRMVLNNITNQDAVVSVFNKSSSHIDGWMPSFNNAYADCFVRKIEGDNQAATIASPGNNAHQIARNTLFHNFSTGVLYTSIDMRAPAKAVWKNYTFSTPGMVFYLGSAKFKSDQYADAQIFYKHTAVHNLGLVYDKGGNTLGIRYGIGDRNFGTTSAIVPLMTGEIEDGHWYRFRIETDLDAETYAFTVYDMGTVQPTIGDPLGSEVFAQTNIPFRLGRANGLGGISSMGFGAYGGKADSRDNMACFDNLTFAWRAPGAAEAVSFYENDFNVRRLRFADFGSSFTYPAVQEKVVSSTLNYDSATTHTLGNMRLVLDNKTGLSGSMQPIGIDGWRRVNDAGTGYLDVFKRDNGNTVLRAVCPGTKGETFLVAANQLGDRYSDGVLDAQIDVRLPNQWYWNTARSVRLGFGNDAAYTANKNQFETKQGLFARAGIAGTAGSSEQKAYFEKGDRSVSTTEATFGKWYRLKFKLDLDKWTWTCAYYDLAGTNNPAATSPDGTKLYEIGETSAITDITAADRHISTFYLYAYAMGPLEIDASKVFAGCTLFDNLVVKHTPAGSSTAVKVYEHLGSRRTAKVRVTGAEIAGDKYYQSEQSVDHWQLVGNNVMAVRIEDDASGKRRLAVYDPGDVTAECPFVNLTAPLGFNAKSGKVTGSFDLRPPLYYSGNGVRAYFRSQIMFSDSSAYTGSFNTGNYYGDHGAFTLGVSYPNTPADNAKDARYLGVWRALPRYGAHRFCLGGAAEDGTSTNLFISGVNVTKDHWYRFTYVADVTRSLVSAKVYDMGTSQPALDAALPTTPVGEWNNVPFRHPVNTVDATKAHGIGTLRLSSYGNYGGGPNAEQEKCYFANIRVKTTAAGLIVLVR